MIAMFSPLQGLNSMCDKATQSISMSEKPASKSKQRSDGDTSGDEHAARDGRATGVTREERRFATRVTIATVIVLSLTALALLIWYSIQILLLIFAGILLAVFLRALADLVSGLTGLGHRWSLLIVILLLLGLSVLAGWLIFPSLAAQLTELADQFQPAVANLREKMEQNRYGKLLLDQSPSLSGMLSGGGALGSLGGFLSQTLDAVIMIVVVIATAMFIALDPQLYIRGTLHIVPPSYRERAGEVMGAVGYTLKWWLIGQGVGMIVVGVAAWVGLTLIGIELALALAFLTAIFNFIPNFGAIISTVPALLIALMHSPEKALWVILLFVLIQNAEGYLVSPNIQRKAVDLPQAISILAQVMMGLLAGALGFLLATPLAAAVHVVVKTLYVEDLLGDDVDTPADQKNLKEVRDVKEAAEGMEDEARAT